MHKLYVVHSSHPSQAVRRALALKGIPHKTVELLIPTHAPLMRLRFGQRPTPRRAETVSEATHGARPVSFGVPVYFNEGSLPELDRDLASVEE